MVGHRRSYARFDGRRLVRLEFHTDFIVPP